MSERFHCENRLKIIGMLVLGMQPTEMLFKLTVIGERLSQEEKKEKHQKRQIEIFCGRFPRLNQTHGDRDKQLDGCTLVQLGGVLRGLAQNPVPYRRCW